MSDSVDYKQKYMAIRQKLIASVDTAYRMGYKAGGQAAQMQAMAQQAQQQVQQAQAVQQQADAQMQQIQQRTQQQQENGFKQQQLDQSVEQQQAAQQAQQQDPQQQGEIDQYIGELEQIVNKSEGPIAEELKKSLDKIKGLRPMSSSYFHNMSPDSKRDLSMQEKIVEDVLKKWESDQKTVQGEISNILGTEGIILKKET